jgi:hypothetical protein
MKNILPMKLGFSGQVLAVILAAVFNLVSGATFAVDSSSYRIVDGLTIYYAAVPAEVIRRYPKDSPEATMHGGVPKGKHVYHLIVALFDSTNMERITDAKVTAIVGEIGLGRKSKPLEPFTIAGALTYGNYFNFSKTATYIIDITVNRPGSTATIKTRFEYRHH